MTPAIMPRISHAGPVCEPQDGEDDQREQYGDGEEVLEEAERPPAADQRDVEVALEDRPVRLDDRQEQDHEAPEREEVRRAGDRPLQQAALAEDLGGLRPQPAAELVGTAVDGLAGADQAHEPPHPPAGERERDDRHQQADHQSQGHGSSCRSRSFPVVPARRFRRRPAA
jgi:hypothetical protein